MKGTPKEPLIDGKSIFFYPAIVLSAGWTILNILKMVAYIDQLKSESPTCTMSNPNRLAILIPTVLAVAIVKKPLETIGYDTFMKLIPVK